MEFIIASQNTHKIAEIKSKLPTFDIVGLDPQVFPDELEETGDTLEENAIQKVEQVHSVTGKNCFADDTGLEVVALDYAPGVRSARYAGDHKSSDDNIDLLLDRLSICRDRSARFRTVIALRLNGETHIFEGVSEGEITIERAGIKGFGYDPIFKPEGSDKTFAQMTMEEKSQWSHRGRAIEKLVAFISHTDFK